MTIRKKQRKVIDETLDELSGRAFRGGGHWTLEEKRMYVQRYAKILSHVPAITRQDRILEVGLCRGVLAFLINRLLSPKRVYTIEHPLTCKLYKKSFLSKLKKEGITLLPCDLNSDHLPWKNDFFDFVIFSEVMEHLIPATALRTSREIYRVLKPTKPLLLSTPNIASLLKRLNLLRGKNALEFDLRLHQGATYGHIREYTMQEIVDLLELSGFTVIKKTYHAFDTSRSVFMRIEGIATRLYPPLGNGIIVLAVK